MGTLQSVTANELCADLSLVQAAVRSSVVPGRAAAADLHWERWAKFSASLSLDPDLSALADPVPILQVFAARYRDGRLAPGGRPVRSRTVEDALRAIGQAFARLGARDIRKDAVGAIDFRLQRQLRSYAKLDPPPDRVKPVPIQLLFHALAVAHTAPTSIATLAITNMAVIAFFFLLRPGEYTGTTSDDTAFLLRDVQLFVGSRRLDLLLAPPTDLLAATAASLTFTTQKNGVRGEVVNHGRSGSPLCCPTLAIVRRLLHLRLHQASPLTPLGTYFSSGPHGGFVRCLPVTSADITDLLQSSARILGPQLGFLPSDVQARSLRAGGAMALLCARVDTNMIRLLGRWQSDIMLCYLHLQAQPVMRHFARQMLAGGNYNLHPGPDVPAP